MKIECKKSKFLFYCMLAAFICCLFLPVPLNAAKFFIESDADKINLEQLFKVDALIDTENEYINAFEGEITFPEDLLSLEQIYDGGSIINFWIERPEKPKECSLACKIQFSGIIPGGHLGKSDLILSLFFKTKKEGNALISIDNTKALYNDGEGTEAPVINKDFKLVISKYAPETEEPSLEDREMPEEFKLEISKDENIFDGRWFLIFSTQDKGSGISHYEIQENKRKKPEEDKWEKVESPYLLKDQKLKSYIFVKAVDRAGNERMETWKPKKLFLYISFIFFGIIIVGYLIRRIYGGKK